MHKPRTNITIGIKVEKDGVLLGGVNRIFTARTNLEALRLATDWTDTYLEISYSDHDVDDLKVTISVPGC